MGGLGALSPIYNAFRANNFPKFKAFHLKSLKSHILASLVWKRIKNCLFIIACILLTVISIIILSELYFLKQW